LCKLFEKGVEHEYDTNIERRKVRNQMKIFRLKTIMIANIIISIVLIVIGITLFFIGQALL